MAKKKTKKRRNGFAVWTPAVGVLMRTVGRNEAGARENYNKIFRDGNPRGFMDAKEDFGYRVIPVVVTWES